MELLKLGYDELPAGWQNLVFDDFKAKFTAALPSIRKGNLRKVVDMGLLYSATYALCCQPPHTCKTGELFEMYKNAVRENWLPRGDERDRFIKVVSNIFLYIERFYAKKLDFETLSGVGHEIMEEMTTWRSQALKTAFRRWSMDEAMMGPVYANGGAAHKRALDWWENEQHKRSKQ